jgi:YegS/Rv2252/BmrU family lipid kinase
MLKQYAKVIVNPTAGANSTLRKWPHISRLLQRIGLSFDHQLTEGVGHAVELAREAAIAGYRFLVAIGGDGTVNEVANGILIAEAAAEADLGMVNTGTGSDFVRSLGVSRDYTKACAALTGQRWMDIDVGVVQYGSGEQSGRRFFVNSAGVGFDAEVAKAKERMPKYFRGTVPYLLGMGRKLLGYNNKTVHLEVDGRGETRKVLSVVVANGAYFGGGMRVAPQADLTDNLLDVLTVGDIGKLELVKAFPSIYKGTHVNHPKVRMERASRVRIESSERLLVHADGEVVGEGPANFWLLPKALRVAV